MDVVKCSGEANPDELMMPTADYSDLAHPKPARNPESIPTMEDIVAIKRCLGLVSGYDSQTL